MTGTSKTLLLTATAMLAFAANSLLCRLALGTQQIDAASFTSIRIVSGALMMGLLILPRARKQAFPGANWRSVGALFVYMICFSIAYLSLPAGTGALILFGAVQLTMILVAIRSGESLPLLSWCGLLLAVAGLVYLVSPGLSAPDPAGAALMTVAGIAWGCYSLLGRATAEPLQATAYNFIFSVPLALLCSLLLLREMHVTPLGVGFAIASGAIASGLGYYIWYAALQQLAAMRAATVQLSVPVIAAIGGVLLLAEPVTLRLLIASAATLGGIAIVLTRRQAG
jgi:drug/metabolite transporter (DMT)-like permease